MSFYYSQLTTSPSQNNTARWSSAQLSNLPTPGQQEQSPGDTPLLQACAGVIFTCKEGVILFKILHHHKQSPGLISTDPDRLIKGKRYKPFHQVPVSVALPQAHSPILDQDFSGISLTAATVQRSTHTHTHAEHPPQRCQVHRGTQHRNGVWDLQRREDLWGLQVVKINFKL
eukprot:scaffold66397_cov17-Tisochrysis_lutea.AAC.1